MHFKSLTNYYTQLAHNSLQTATTSNIVPRHIKSINDPSTQIVSEFGTTDIAIGVIVLTIYPTYFTVILEDNST